MLHKSLIMRITTCWVALLIALPAIAERRFDLKTPKGELTVVAEDSRKLDFDFVAITGYLENHTDIPLVDLRISMTSIDKNGKPVNLCGRNKCVLSWSKTIQPGARERLESASGNRFGVANRFSRKPVDIGFEFVSADVVVDYKLATSTFVDSGIELLTAMDARSVRLKAENNSNSSVELDWDKSSFIRPTGTNSRIAYGDMRYIDIARPVAATLVAPHSHFETAVWPIDVLFLGGAYPILKERFPIAFDFDSLSPLVRVSIGYF